MFLTRLRQVLCDQSASPGYQRSFVKPLSSNKQKCDLVQPSKDVTISSRVYRRSIEQGGRDAGQFGVWDE